MALNYENCNENCSNNRQNITICVPTKGVYRTTQSFANEHTIEMIKILIGKWNRYYFDDRRRNVLVTSI